MNKIIVNGKELHDAEVVITTNEAPTILPADDPPPAGGGPGEEHGDH